MTKYLMDDVVWLDSIVDKLVWKHNVTASEVEDVLTGQCRIFKKEKGHVIRDLRVSWQPDLLPGWSIVWLASKIPSRIWIW